MRTTYIKEKQMTPTDWLQKEKRELFCKAVNSLIMEGKLTPTEAIDQAKIIVDKAFEFFPDAKPEEEIEESAL